MSACLALVVAITSVGAAHAGDSCLPAWQPVWPAGSQDRATGRVFARDSRGFTWVGGSLGLFRLDGQSVTAWYPQPERSTGLPGPQVEALWIDAQDNVWIGTAGGLARRDARTGRIERVSLRRDGGSQPEIFSLHRHGPHLIAGTQQGLAVLRLVDGVLVREADAPGPRPPRVYGMASAGDRLYAATTNGLLVADATRAFAFDEQANEQLPSLLRDAFLEVIAGPDGRLYAGSRLGVVAFAPDAPAQAEVIDAQTVPGFLEGAIFALAFDHLDRLWVGGTRGLGRWTPGEATAQVCPTTPRADGDDGGSGIAYLWTGGDGELWVGMARTDKSVRTRLESPGVERVLNDPRSAPGLEGELWAAALLADGRLWAATGKGLLREDPPGSRHFEAWRADTFGDKPIYTLASDVDGDLWIGGPLGLYVDDGDRLRRITWWSNAGPPRPGAPPIFMLRAAGDDLWVAGAAGLAQIDAKRNEVVVLYSGSETVHAPEGAETVLTPNIRPWAVSISEGGRVFAAGEAGVLSIDPRARSFRAATQFGEAEDAPSYPGSAAVDVAALGAMVYVGDEAGLFVTDEEFSSWDRLSVPYPRPSRASRGIAVDVPRQAVWFSTIGGVLRYAPKDDTRASPWRFFDSLSGLHANTFSEGAIQLLDGGRLLVSEARGLSVIDPDEVPDDVVVAPQLLALSVDDQRQTLPAVDAVIPVTAAKRRVSFTFGSPDVWIGPDVRLEYQLDAYDPLPRRQDLALPVIYEGLPPKRYRLRVRLASAQRGSSPWTTLIIDRQPAWWQTPWAQATAAALLILFALGAVRLRVRQLTSRAQLVADERDRIARELHDRHLQELIGALMIGRRLRGRMADERLKDQSGEMVQLLERSSESARATIRMLAPPQDEQPFAEQIRFHAECTSRAFSTPVEVGEEGERWRMTDQQRRHAVRIVNEAVINALKHAQGERVAVTIAWTSRRLVTTVLDDGGGIGDARAQQTHAENPGLGLRNMQQLARAIGASLAIRPGEERGTRVTLTLRRPPLWSRTRWQAPPAPTSPPPPPQGADPRS